MDLPTVPRFGGKSESGSRNRKWKSSDAISGVGPGGFAESVRLRQDQAAMGEVNPEESLEIGRGVFKRLGDCTGSDIESAIRLIAQRRIDRAWIAEQAAGPDRMTR